MTHTIKTPSSALFSHLRLYADTTRPGRVVRREEAVALGQYLLQAVRDQSQGVFVEHTARTVTTVGENCLQDWQVGDELGIWFQSKFGSGFTVQIASNQMDRTALQAIVEQAKAMLPPPLPPDQVEQVNPDDPQFFTLIPRQYLPVSLWSDRTAQAVESQRRTEADSMVEEIIAAVTRVKLKAAATLVTTARSVLYTYQLGLTAWAQETDSELTVSTYTPDGTSTGWAGAAHRDVSTLNAEAVAAAAIQLTEQGRNATVVEPGRRTAILSPYAVAQLVRFMPEAFSGSMAKIGMSPLAEQTKDGQIKLRLRQRVLDPRLRMISDPTDPDGGFLPFFEFGNPWNPAGLEIPAMTWIENGVLQHYAWDMQAAGRQWCELPYSVRLDAMPGTQTATLEAMIADCPEGIFINRFGGLNFLDRRTGMMTGVTRDGCFLVKNGKIEKPVKHFRFLESPFHLFNRVEMIGPPSRVALGQDCPTPRESSLSFTWPAQGPTSHWPRVPIITAPMMIRDFNFTALSDAI